MPIGLLLILVVFPLVELAVLITAGQRFGLWPVIGVILATGVVGLLVLRLTGVAVLKRMVRGSTQDPLPAMMDTTLLVSAGVLLMFPGLIGDAIGLLLLLPPVRRLVAPVLWRPDRMRFRVYRRQAWRGPGDPDGPAPGTGPRPGPRRPGDDQVIEGEFERLGERTVDPRRPSDPKQS